MHNQNVLDGFQPTNMQDSILSSTIVRSVHGPTRYHTRSPNTFLMWCPQTRLRSNGTFSSGPAVSQFSIVVACPSIQATVFGSGGIYIWQLNSSSFLSVLTHATRQSQCSLGQSIFQRDRPAQRFPSWLRVLPFLHLLLLRRPASRLVLHRCVWSHVPSSARPPTLPASQLLGAASPLRYP